MSRVPLDPEAADYLELLRRGGIPPLESLSVAEARLQLAPAPEPPGLVGTVDESFPGPAGPIPIRRYQPGRAAPAAAATAAIVFFHGGGWILGSLDSHDGLCRVLCLATQAQVIAVDYRRGPEHRFPAAVDDAVAAARWVVDQSGPLGINPRQIAVCGDSAGGNLAAVVALRLRGTGALQAQVLWYPITDYSFETTSYVENGHGYFLSRKTMEWFWTNYLSHPQDGHLADASPLRADCLQGLPAAYVMTVGYDPLRDEGRAYAARLVSSGVDVTFVEHPGMVHGFLRRPDRFPRARRAVEDTAAFLAQAFGG